MADRIRMRLNAIIEGLPLMNEISEFTPPEITYKSADSEGSFVASEDMVGMEKLSFTLKVRGDKGTLNRAFGPFMMKPGQLNFVERGKTTDGLPYREEHSLYALIKSIKQDTYKMGEKPSCTIEGTCKAYKLTDNGATVHNINTETGKTVVYGVDLMGEAGIA